MKSRRCFGVDIRYGNSPLKLEFPRLFRLAKLKNGMVIDYSNNSGFSKVKWEDLFIRPLLDRELRILSRLTERVKSVVLVPDLEDSLDWAHDNKGEFSVKKLTNLLIEGERDEINFAFDKIWKLKVPPRLRNFLIDRVLTKDFLVKRGVHLQNKLNVCPWCECEQERVDHLFFKCNFIVGFWRRIFNWWEVGWKMFNVSGMALRKLRAVEVFLETRKELRPWSQQTTFANMERRLACVGEVAFSKAEQHDNEMVDTLTTTGINCRVIFKVW
ncbi:hypothetical protein PVK06_016586 [Gossypium arboreum]|uniref:Reverse transcriptase zinc-binding domain-containing protein n=1 Tax=Gossypium arboreum TaxID=29729 RepID=A0ABR0Q0G5_GOSAR|nr:hypothetical protein PVK06_016586 [Gossypium arboreum]